MNSFFQLFFAWGLLLVFILVLYVIEIEYRCSSLLSYILCFVGSILCKLRKLHFTL